MRKIERGDYVIINRDLENIANRSVGWVKNVSGSDVDVFFIGLNEVFNIDIAYLVYLDLTKTGKPHEQKICNICHILKPMSEFDVNQTDAQGRKTTRPSCKECRVAIDGTPLKPSERRRLMVDKPTGVFTCPICNKTSIPGVTANLVIDHDHVTGKARKWICDSCNTGLGRFKDDIKLLEAVIEYLKMHNKT
jgi:hypothetical protein